MWRIVVGKSQLTMDDPNASAGRKEDMLGVT